jgi:LysR family nitrogen assimilation transcriptional regulator
VHRQLTGAVDQRGGLADAVELRELRYFAASARAGNLASAARDLHVTASAVSQQLRKLEDTLGIPLLVRHGRGVMATPAGCRLLERIDAVVRLLNTPLGPEDPHAAPGGTITLALPAELAAMLAMPVLAALRQQLPHLTPVIKESADGCIDSWMLNGQADLAILPDPAEFDELHIDRVLTEGLGIAAAPRSAPAASVRPLRLHQLAGLPLILPGKRHWGRRLLARAAFQHGVRCDPAFEVDSLAITRDMVRQGLGYALLPAAAIREETARGSLVFCPLEKPPLAVTYAIASGTEAAPLVREAGMVVRGVMQSLAANGQWPGARPCRAAEAPILPATAPGAQDAGRPVVRAARASADNAFAGGDLI